MTSETPRNLAYLFIIDSDSNNQGNTDRLQLHLVITIITAVVLRTLKYHGYVARTRVSERNQTAYQDTILVLLIDPFQQVKSCEKNDFRDVFEKEVKHATAGRDVLTQTLRHHKAEKT